MLDATPTPDAQVETLLEVNNIEVIYNSVILVLKGVSLKVPKGGIQSEARLPKGPSSIATCPYISLIPPIW